MKISTRAATVRERFHEHEKMAPHLRIQTSSLNMKISTGWLMARATRRVAAGLLALAAALIAGETRNWTQGEFADFEKGVLKNLSLRSDGLLTLAPHSREVFDTSSAYLWTLAQDSKGNLYAGGGTGAKLSRIPPGGAGKVAAEFDAMEIHAVAVA